MPTIVRDAEDEDIIISRTGVAEFLNQYLITGCICGHEGSEKKIKMMASLTRSPTSIIHQHIKCSITGQYTCAWTTFILSHIQACSQGVCWVWTNPLWDVQFLKICIINLYCSTNIDVAKLMCTITIFTILHVGTITIFTILDLVGTVTIFTILVAWYRNHSWFGNLYFSVMGLFLLVTSKLTVTFM